MTSIYIRAHEFCTQFSLMGQTIQNSRCAGVEKILSRTFVPSFLRNKFACIKINLIIHKGSSMRNELIIYRWNEGGKHLKTVDYFDHAREEARMTEALADEFLPLSLILNMILNVE